MNPAETSTPPGFLYIRWLKIGSRLCLVTATLGSALIVPHAEEQSSAYEQNLAKARIGDVSSQVQVGVWLTEGTYVRRNYADAAHWFEAASAQGSEDATGWLGAALIRGWTGHTDVRRGTNLLESAISAGSVVSLRLKAELVRDALLSGESNDEVLRLYRLAADRGEPIASDRLGSAYLTGDHVQKNIDKAALAFYQGISLECSQCEVHLGQLYNSGWSFEDPDAGHLIAGETFQAKSFTLFQNAAARGDRIAIHNLALMLRQGLSCSPQPEKARLLLESSARRQYLPSRAALASMLENGEGGAPDLGRALALYLSLPEDQQLQYAPQIMRLRKLLSPVEVARANEVLESIRTLERYYQQNPTGVSGR